MCRTLVRTSNRRMCRTLPRQKFGTSPHCAKQFLKSDWTFEIAETSEQSEHAQTDKYIGNYDHCSPFTVLFALFGSWSIGPLPYCLLWLDYHVCYGMTIGIRVHENTRACFRSGRLSILITCTCEGRPRWTRNTLSRCRCSSTRSITNHFCSTSRVSPSLRTKTGVRRSCRVFNDLITMPANYGLLLPPLC